jgi:hypothetical protein
MAKDVSRLECENLTMIEMQVRTANGGASDFYDDIIGLSDIWNRSFDHAGTASMNKASMNKARKSLAKHGRTAHRSCRTCVAMSIERVRHTRCTYQARACIFDPSSRCLYFACMTVGSGPITYQIGPVSKSHVLRDRAQETDSLCDVCGGLHIEITIKQLFTKWNEGGLERATPMFLYESESEKSVMLSGR